MEHDAEVPSGSDGREQTGPSTRFSTSARAAVAQQIANDLTWKRDLIVNLYFIGPPGGGDRSWVLVDTGVTPSPRHIIDAAARLFGSGSRPAAIVLTHGHFDHVAAVEALARRWDAPVYAHDLELPYLTGRSAYPPPDPTVGGGAMTFMSRAFSRNPIDLRGRVHSLPADGTVPGAPGWRWIHTPGHAPGHVSLFRESDRALIAGDAFVTTKQESVLAVMQQRQEIHGPPMYFTPDWAAARRSVEELAALRPALAATGHGTPMRGDRLLRGLETLVANFDRLAKPAHGRYVKAPAVTDERGIVSVPPPVPDPAGRVVAGVAVVAAAGLAIAALRRREGRDRQADAGA